MPFVFTPEQKQEIAKTRADKAKWERVIANASARLKEADDKLAAVATLNGGSMDIMADAFEEGGMNAAAEDANDNMTAAIETLANTAVFPLSHRQMRDHLRTQGFPEDRLGNYYYTAVHRLKGKKRITITNDKKIGRAPA